MRLHNLDLNLLVVLDILIAEQSVSQTAQRLNMTQPAISNALARLRSHFNDDLFVVMGRRMVPTPLCEKLAAPVRRAIDELSLIANTRASFDPATSDCTFTIIASDYVFLVFLSEAVRRLAVDAPAVRLRILLTNEEMVGLLQSGRADFGIFPEPRKVDGLPFEPLFSDSYSVVAWSENNALGKRLSLKAYLSAKHVSTAIAPSNPSHIEQESLDRHGIHRDIAVYAPYFSGVAEIVVGTQFLATMHSRAARIMAKRLPLRVMAPPVTIDTFRIGLQWFPGRVGDPSMDWIRRQLILYATELQP